MSSTCCPSCHSKSSCSCNSSGARTSPVQLVQCIVDLCDQRPVNSVTNYHNALAIVRLPNGSLSLAYSGAKGIWGTMPKEGDKVICGWTVLDGVGLPNVKLDNKTCEVVYGFGESVISDCPSEVLRLGLADFLDKIADLGIAGPNVKYLPVQKSASVLSGTYDASNGNFGATATTPNGTVLWKDSIDLNGLLPEGYSQCGGQLTLNYKGGFDAAFAEGGWISIDAQYSYDDATWFTFGDGINSYNFPESGVDRDIPLKHFTYTTVLPSDNLQVYMRLRIINNNLSNAEEVRLTAGTFEVGWVEMCRYALSP